MTRYMCVCVTCCVRVCDARPLMLTRVMCAQAALRQQHESEIDARDDHGLLAHVSVARPQVPCWCVCA
jgi:hypothetical protein